MRDGVEIIKIEDVNYTATKSSRKSEASSTMRAFASSFWYLSLFIMCKAWHQYHERPHH